MFEQYLGSGRLAVLERWLFYRGKTAMFEQYLGSGRLAVLERWLFYRGRLQCLSNIWGQGGWLFREVAVLQR